MQSSFVDPIQYEIAKEQAEGLVRIEKRFLEALEAYRQQGEGASAESSERGERVLWDLVDALTWYVVQREACGLRDARQLYSLYQVPREAIARIGVRRPRDSHRRGRARSPGR
jgi:hypothetical protein